MDRIGIVQHEQAGLAAAQITGGSSPIGERRACGRSGDVGKGTFRVEPDPAFGADAAHQVVEGIDGFQVEQTVGMSAGGPTANSDTGPVFLCRELPCQALNDFNRALSVQVLGQTDAPGNIFGSEGFQRRRAAPAGQPSNVHAGSLQTFGNNHVCQAEGQVAFPSGCYGHPLVGIGGCHGEPRVNVVKGAPLVSAFAVPEFPIPKAPTVGGNPG